MSFLTYLLTLGGWAVAGGRFALTLRLGLMFYAASRPARAQKGTPLVRPRRLAGREEVHSARGGRQQGAVGRGLGWVGVPKSDGMPRSGRVRIVPVVRGRGRFGRVGTFQQASRRRSEGASARVAPSRQVAARSTLSGVPRPPLMNLL